MSVKISELPLLDSLADNDIIAGVDTSADATKKIELSTLKEYTNANIDLTDYVKNTDYASSNGGVIKVSAGQGTATNSSGYLIGQTRTYAQYQSDANTLFVCKGTLDNVLTARIGDLETILETLDTGSGVNGN